MPRSRTKRRQHGGMKFTHEVLQHYFIDRGIEYNDLNVMNYLIANTEDIRIVWDASTYSFIFELKLKSPHGLIDPYGLPLDESVATHAAYTAARAAAAAGTPEPGTRVSTFCVKMSFVHDDSGDLIKEYKTVLKQTTSSYRAKREARTQGRLKDVFSCRGTKVSFVPDVIVHAILTGPQFLAIFEKILSSTPPTKEIYDWLNEWIESDEIMVNVICMEMIDFEREAPGVPRTKPFQIIHSLRSNPAVYELAALRMMADIAEVRGKGIMPHDLNEGNGMATPDGNQVYLIDWGGIFDLNIESDRLKLFDIFERMCKDRSRSRTTDATNDAALVGPTETEQNKRLARFPSLEELCGFFKIVFNDTEPNYRKINIDNLKIAFETHLMAVVDFTCVPPNPDNVHSALMMVAFVDFMVNLMIFNHPYCQCRNVLKVVYPNQNVSVKIPTVDINVTPFDDFRTFLKTFAVASFPAIITHMKLREVVAMIEENVRLCPSACGGVPLHVTHLRPDSWINAAISEKRERLKAERLEAEIMRAEAAEAMRLAEARRVKENKAAAASKKTKKVSEKSSGVSGERSGVGKQPALTTPQKASQASQAAQAAEEVPGRWYNPKSWSWLSWFSKKKGGTRKQCKQRKCFTRRKHN